MIDSWNDQTYHIATAALFGVCALIFALGRYRKKAGFLRIEMKIMGVGMIFWCVSHAIKAEELSPSLDHRGPADVVGFIGALLYVIAGIFVLGRTLQNGKRPKPNLSRLR